MLCDCGAPIGTVPCWQLVALAGAIGVVWACTLQLLLNLTLFRAVAAAVTGKPSSSVEVAKLIQQFSEFSTYGSMLGVGLAYVPFTPCFADAAACWEEIGPVTRVLPALLVVYLLQLSAYVQMLITERLLRRATPFPDRAAPGRAWDGDSASW